jgi:hypothetical protein
MSSTRNKRKATLADADAENSDTAVHIRKKTTKSLRAEGKSEEDEGKKDNTTATPSSTAWFWSDG